MTPEASARSHDWCSSRVPTDGSLLAAAVASLQVGDEIIQINGIASSTISVQEALILSGIAGRSQPIHLPWYMGLDIGRRGIGY